MITIQLDDLTAFNLYDHLRQQLGIPDAGAQVQVVPVKAPITLPVTGHSLPAPEPEHGEMFVGYCQRVALAAGGNPGIVGALFQGTDQLGDVRDPNNWPLMADKFFNGRAYMTPAERALSDAATAQFNSNLRQTAQRP